MPQTPSRPDPDILGRLALFAGLGAGALRDVMAAGRVRTLARGDRIFVQGDPGTTCHVLLSGRVKIQQTGPDGRQSVIAFIGPEGMYGTLAMFLKSGYPGDAVAVLDGRELVWSAETMRGLMLRHPAIALNALAMLGSRLQELQSRLAELSTQRVEDLLARTILRLVEQAGSPSGSGVAVGFPLSRQDLAEMTGTTVFTVSRLLSTWEEQGIIEGGHRQKLVVLDLPGLRALVEPGGRPPPEGA